MNILLFGVQGSGKSTVGKYIAQKLNIPFIATGDIFRKLREENSDLGKLVKKMIDSGTLVPDEPTMKLVNQRLAEENANEGFVLDGAPRNLAQIQMFSKDTDLILQVELDKNEAVKRLLARARHDDTKEKIEKRMSWYKDQTELVVSFYKDKGIKIIKIDNSPSEETVRKNLDVLLEEFKRN